MSRRWRVIALAACILALGAAGAAPAATSQVKLDFYTATVSTDAYGKLLKQFDLTTARPVKAGVRVDMVLSQRQAQALKARGIGLKLVLNQFGRSSAQEARHQAAAGFTVWRDYDDPSNGIAAQLHQIAASHPQIADLQVIGHTAQGREILALKIAQNPTKLSNRPAVLFSATQHAREWIATETDMRILKYYVGKYDAHDKGVQKLLQNTALWFVPVMNPDGYQYTFLNPGTRLWRKNLRDNNGNGTIEVGDGVDPNRNYPEHWNYDEEGSSSVPSSDTYRGPSAGSEPETTAMTALLHREHFKFQVNFHSFGPYLLYPEGWQISTPTADDPIYYALSGNKTTPAIDGFNPGLSSDVLYVTNGESTDYAHVHEGTLAWTPELDEGCTGCGFVFPDDETAVQNEFLKVLPFAQDVVNSAQDPSNPVSHLGIHTKAFYLKSDDTFKAGLPLSNFTFAVSYGDPQPVRVTAKRDIGQVTVKWRINGGPVHSANTHEYDGGKRYGGKTDVYYHVMEGQVRGTTPGDSVQVWFEGSKGATSDSFTYQAAKETRNRVLIVSAEDYSGASPVQTPGPHYLSYYTDALTANHIKYDVYDVDANSRTAPSELGVLSHYDGVIWYTGDDTVTREPGWGAGNASRLAMDEMLAMREYLNEGGRVFYSGRNAGAQFTPNLGAQLYDPTAANAMCSSSPTVAGRCLALSGSGDGQNDVLEYWFGAYLMNYGAGLDDNGDPFNVNGTDNPFNSMSWGLNGPDSADNQTVASSFITTSGILPPATYPQFTSWPAAKYDRPGGPFVPHTGNSYVYSQIADVSYKRLMRTFTVPAGGGNLSFWTSYNTEQDWDHLFVEVHTVGQDNWTTLPDANGHTSQATGESCKAENSGGWRTLHPFLDHYQTQSGQSACTPTGTTGAWNAATGDSGGWQNWSLNMNAYAGQQVEVSISYASDWATQGLGVFVDDVTLPDGTSTSFETSLDGWTVAGPPPGDAPNSNDWIRTTAAGFPEGAVVATPDTIYMGFGFEGISTAAARDLVMGRAVNYLLR
jgi:hypothetical protein